MGIHVNIDGSKKILSSLYANIDGANKKLSALYANVNGASKDVLAVKYAWKRYKATSWEQVYGSLSTYTEETTCVNDNSQIHTVTEGYVSPWYSPYTSYESFSFNSSTGVFTGNNGAEFDTYVHEDPDEWGTTGTDPYNRWIIIDSSKHQICKVYSGYNAQILCKTYNVAGMLMSVEYGPSGFTTSTYYYAKPTSYATNYDIVTSTYRWSHPDNDAGCYVSENGQYAYDGYKYEYIGQI